MCFLVENVRFIHYSQDVNEKSVVRLLIKLTLLRLVIFIKHLVHSLKELSHEFMFIYGVNA